jgi:hypothetical protein
MPYQPLQLPCDVLPNPDGTFTVVIRGALYDGLTLVYNAESGQFVFSPIITAGEF